MTPDLALARRNMVSNQVRTWEVLDARVLDVLGHTAREDYVTAPYQALAYADLELPLAHGERMMKPVVEGRLLQALELRADDQVLEIGTGSGYLTACLAQLSGHVHSLEIHADLSAAATTRLAAAGITNVSLQTADAMHAPAPAQRFDAIAVTGAMAELPQPWLGWLKPGGRLFVVEGAAPAMQAVLLRLDPTGGVQRERLFETELPYLQHAAPRVGFVL